MSSLPAVPITEAVVGVRASIVVLQHTQPTARAAHGDGLLCVDARR